MDAELRRRERDGDVVAEALFLRRNGRADEALDLLSPPWREGDAGAGELFVEIAREVPEAERCARLGERLDRLAHDGVEAARKLWLDWFAPAAAIVGTSEAARALRAFVYRHARKAGPLLIAGERGVGRTLAVRAIHGLSGRDELFDVPQSRLMSLELRAVPVRATLHMADVQPGSWEAEALEACAKGSRLIVTCRHVDVGWSVGLVLALEESFVIPPLRQRTEDIAPIARAFIAHEGLALRDDAALELERSGWDWNVAQLRDVMERAARIRPPGSAVITPVELPNLWPNP